MKRYDLDMGHRHGRPTTEWDLFEMPDGEWVRYEEANARIAELIGQCNLERARAEAAELRAGGYHCHYDAQVLRAEAVESRLAAANALLVRHSRRGSYAEDIGLIHDTKAFLANQPAADEMSQLPWDAEDQALAEYGMRTEDTALLERFYGHVHAGRNAEQAKALTQAEQAVLEACGAIHDTVVRGWAPRPERETPFVALCRAELARRGLAP